jgi:hypothetical protein
MSVTRGGRWNPSGSRQAYARTVARRATARRVNGAWTRWVWTAARGASAGIVSARKGASMTRGDGKPLIVSAAQAERLAEFIRHMERERAEAPERARAKAGANARRNKRKRQRKARQKRRRQS